MANRIATVRVRGTPGAGGPGGRLTRVLLAGSPRVLLAGPTLGRLDARGWDRRGGEEELARVLREAARREGLAGARVGIADVAVAADAAARVAGSEGADVAGAGRAVAEDDPEGTPVRVVPPGGARGFLAPLPVDVLPLSEDLVETLRALGMRRVGELAELDRREVETRLGPEGVRALRLARGEDGRPLVFGRPVTPPSASLGLEAPVRSTEPLLFGLRQLLHRVCRDLSGAGRCAARLTVEMRLETGEGRDVEVPPARPTRREGLLFDLCRAALERTVGGGGLPAPVEGLVVRVDERVLAEVRQGELFGSRERDPLGADAALSRLRARLGPDAVVRPAAGEGHRPEARDVWVPVGSRSAPGGAEGPPEGRRSGGREPEGGEGDALPGVLHLLPRPATVRVSCRAGRPVVLRGPRGRQAVEAAEGPERISGGWWEGPYAREYWWICTEGRELLWIFRERRPRRGDRWRLHGWWD